MKNYFISLCLVFVLLAGCAQRIAPLPTPEETFGPLFGGQEETAEEPTESFVDDLDELGMQLNDSQDLDAVLGDVDEIPEPSNVSFDVVVLDNQTSLYSLEEVALHSDSSDCWLVVQNKVYDVTDFIPSHPGGSAILAGCGTDATGYFTDIHTRQAWDLLPLYYIGDLQ